ncbi:hypothetical protein GGR57DRAFT_520926 [Xylariaceae sp. FL1272]|nr:hypothetical protein GGR57DRAFT_520926 [Xylariaceae sp. FL1272]
MSLPVKPRHGDQGHAAYWLGRASVEAVDRGWATRATATSAEPVTVESFVSSLWALHLEGLERVYESLASTAKGAEISYDVGRTAFRIKCLPQQEVELTAVVQSTLTEVSDADDSSNLVMPIDDWRSNVDITANILEAYQRYSYPVSIALYDVRETWKLDDELPQKGITTETFLPEFAQSEIERLTNTQLLRSCDGKSVYIGARASEDATKATNKLNNLAECFFAAHNSKRQEMAIVLHNDGDRSQIGEYRYVKDENASLLKSFVLDATFRDKREAYLEIFHHAVIVRMVSSHRPCIPVPSIQRNTQPVAKGPDSTEQFIPFENWKYAAKARVLPTAQSVAAGQSLATLKAASSQPSTTQKMLNTEQWISEVPSIKTHDGQVVSSPKRQASRSLSSMTVNSDRVVKTRTPRQKSIKSGSPKQHGVQQKAIGLAGDQQPAVKQEDIHDERSQGESLHEKLKSAAQAEPSPSLPRQPVIHEQTPVVREELKDCQSVQQDSEQNEKARNKRHFQEIMQMHAVTEAKVAEEQRETNLPVLTLKPSRIFDGPDPFSSLWTSARASHTGHRSSMGSDARGAPRVQPEDEKGSRSYHTTMNQQAPSRKNHKPKPVKLDISGSTMTQTTVSQPSRNVSPSRTMAQVASQGMTPGNSQVSSSRTKAQGTNYANSQGSSHTVTSRITIERPHYPVLDPRMVQQLNSLLIPVLAPFQLSQGLFELRAEIGRLFFQDVNEKKVQIWGDDERERHYEIGRIIDDCSTKYRPAFTRVLSSIGADANYISQIRDDAGNLVWCPISNRRQTFYEFQCVAKSEHRRGEWAFFWIDVNANDLTFKIRDDNPERRIYGVHCTKRAWDFRLILTGQQDLQNTCGEFAKSLIDSLQITPSNSSEPGRLPQLKFTTLETSRAGVCSVRVCNVASYVRRVEQESLKLDISEVWDMHTTKTIRQGVAVYVSHQKGLQEGDTVLGDLPKWYEASIQAKSFRDAFEENKELEFGERAKWSPEDLIGTKALDSLVRGAVEMVQKMDGVGFWNNNGFEDVWSKVTRPPKSRLMNRYW